MNPAIDREQLIQLLRDLVSTDSVNPSLVPGASGEQAVAKFLSELLRQHALPAELQDAAPGRPNVISWLGPDPPLRDGRRHASLGIFAHIDTVGAGDMPGPFRPAEKDGRLYGRGALDIKSGVAAMIAAALAAARSGVGLARTVLLAAVVDEECDSIGTSRLLEEFRVDAAIVMEPTNLLLVVAHKGFAWFEVIARGRAAHGSLPAEGRDAIRAMGRVLQKLDLIEASLRLQPPHPLLGDASLHASLISGGQELSSYPAECRLQYERRLLPGESEQTAREELERAIAELQSSDAEFSASVRSLAARPPYEISPDAPIARAAGAAIRAVTGDLRVAGMSPWTDTALLAAQGIPGVVFGPSGRGLHGREEYVLLESVDTCAQVLLRLILDICAEK